MKKKVLSMLLCAAMATSMLAACGSNDAPASSEAEKPSQSSEAASSEAASSDVEEEKPLYPIVDEPITVKGAIVTTRDVSNGRKCWDMVTEVTGINFEWIAIDEESVGTYLASGDWDFDFWVTPLDSTMIADYGITGGMFANYKDYLDVMPNFKNVITEMYPVTEKAITESNGAIYRLPHVGEGVTATQIRGYFRKDLLEEIGQEMPKTIDDFYNILKLMKEKTGKPAWCPANLSESSYMGAVVYTSFGPDVNPDFDADDNGNVIYNRISDQYKRYLEFMNKLYEEELIDTEYLTVDTQYCLGLAKAEETVFYSGEAHSFGPDMFENEDMSPLSALAPMTSEWDDTQTYLAPLPVSSLGGYFINAESEYIEELCKAFDIMYAWDEVVEGSSLNGQAFCYGKEGEDYILYDDGTYSTHTPDGYEGSFTDYQYNELIFTNGGLSSSLKDYVTSTPGNGQARQKAFLENVIPYHCPEEDVFPGTFLKFTEDEQEVITGKYTDVKAYMEEMKSKFISGVADIDTEWESYVKGLNDRGLEEVLEVYQASYDRWMGQ